MTVILEVAYIDVLPGHERDFETAIAYAAETVLPQAKGFLGFTGHGWGVERPNVFLFTIRWESLEDHTIGFRESELFAEWRNLIGSHFASDPVVEHFTD